VKDFIITNTCNFQQYSKLKTRRFNRSMVLLSLNQNSPVVVTESIPSASEMLLCESKLVQDSNHKPGHFRQFTLLTPNLRAKSFPAKL
jgi:hypothetical protein